MPRFALREHPLDEPTNRIVLRWGDHAGRYLVGTAMILCGAFLIMQTTAYTLQLWALGCLLHLAGWLLQPARGWRRLLVAGPSMLCCFATVSGAGLIWVLSATLALWLFVRERPASAYPVVAVPLAVGLALAQVMQEGADKPLVFVAVLAAIVAGAWLAREWALRVVRLDPSAARRPHAPDTP